MQTQALGIDGGDAAFLDGNPAAFGRLFESYRPRMLAMACRLLQNTCDAEDVLQDSFLAIYRHRASFQYQARLSTWMYSILLNRVRNHLRHARVLRWSSLDAPVATEDGDRPFELADGQEDVEAEVERRLEREALERAADGLPPDYGVIFRMYYFDHAALADIARRLGRPLGTVKVYLHRARKLVIESLSQEAGACGGSLPS